ncbi:glycosyl transferase group 7 protein [Nitzschia inconspicua]|uniref:Glycosyl transferase group 7 protein n=1 Tax=Nitzschia inconspicua TaxID=303405 RepID=A0A9K3LZD3_9STRA|nr:glycosyl transferase group 7 protein [Nitzschia inconspicua]
MSPGKNDVGKMPLPDGWIRTYSKSQQRYYYSHKDTKHTQWHFPSVSEAKDPWLAKKRAEENQRKEQEQAKANAAANLKRPRPEERSEQESKKLKPETATAAPSDVDDLLALADTSSVAIIVPFRDLHIEQKRSAHLGQFVPHMIKFLSKLQQQHQIADFHIYIIEQSDDKRKFNRGKLLNIGFDIARKRKGMKRPHDVFIFHDVDLLPQDDLGRAYAQFPKVPYHIARVWDRYSNNPKYFGGVVSFSSSDFKRINGYPNTFWGWGGEDDELQLRCNALGIKWAWPRQGTLVDLEEMTLQEKLKFLKQHKEWKCMVKWEALEEHDKTWKQNGLADLSYKVLKSDPLDTKDAAKSKATKITVDVKLNGNHWANDKCGVDYMGG